LSVEPDPDSTGSPLVAIFGHVGLWVVRARIAIIIGVALLTVGFAWSAARVQVNNDHRNFFVKNDPLLDSQARFEDRFGSDDFVMVYVEGDLFSQASYEAIDRLYEKMAALEYEGQPAFLGVLSPFHAPTLRSDTGTLDAKPVLDPEGGVTDEKLADAKKRITNHPVYKNLIVDKSGTSGAIFGPLASIEGPPELFDTFLATEMNALMEDPALEPLGALLVGGPIFRQTMNSATFSESAIFGGVSVLVCILALYFMFRRKRQVTAAIIVVVLAVIWTVGAMSFAGVPFSLVSTILPLAIIITGLGSCVHIVNAFAQLSARGLARREAAAEAVRTMGVPCALTAATTAIGFMSIVTAPVQPMRELGLFASLGLVIAFFLAITLVPAILSLGSPNAPMPERDKARQERSDVFFAKLASNVVANKQLVALTFLVGAALMATGIPRIKVETHFLHSLRGDQPFRQAVEHVDERLGGSNAVELMIDTGSPGGVYEPKLLKAMDQLERWLISEQGHVVGNTLSAVGLFKELNQAILGERKLPDTAKQAAELLFLYEQGGLDTRLGMDAERRYARISIRTRAMTSAQAVALETAIRGKAAELLDEVPVYAALPKADTPAPTPAPDEDPDAIVIEESDEGDDTIVIEESDEGDDTIVIEESDEGDDTIVIEESDEGGDGGSALASAPPAPPPAAPREPLAGKHPQLEVAGTAQLFVHLNDYVIQSQLSSFALAAFIIAIVMVLMLRSVALGLAIMVPNLLPIVGTYGLMGWLGVNVDFLTAVVGVAALGVAVDGTIHIGTRYRISRGLGRDADGAAHDVMTKLGRALVVTSGVLTVGFASVSPSIVAALARFGISMALCLLLAMLYDLLMTPAVLAWLSPNAPAAKKDAGS
jgi:predicted RND superfamily exporter protein